MGVQVFGARGQPGVCVGGSPGGLNLGQGFKTLDVCRFASGESELMKCQCRGGGVPCRCMGRVLWGAVHAGLALTLGA